METAAGSRSYPSISPSRGSGPGAGWCPPGSGVLVAHANASSNYSLLLSDVPLESGSCCGGSQAASKVVDPRGCATHQVGDRFRRCRIREALYPIGIEG